VLLLLLVLRLKFFQWQESTGVFQVEHHWPIVSLWRVGKAGIFDGAVAIIAVVVRGDVGTRTVTEVDSGCKRDGFAPAADYGKTG